MIKTIAWAVAALLLIAAAAGVGIWLAPLMLSSGRPELILLAYLLPFCGVVAGLSFYIAWADTEWCSDPRKTGPRNLAKFAFTQSGTSPRPGPLLPIHH